MKKAYMRRYGAYGDLIHATHIPRLLKEKEGFDYVAVEYNPKGMAVWANNPFIDNHIHFDPYQPPICDYPASFLQKRMDVIVREGNYDHCIDLNGSLEYGYIAMEDDNIYYQHESVRRERFGKWNYYDQNTIFAGYPQHVGMVGELFFTDEERAMVENIFNREYKDNFVVIANLSGTSKHKLFYDAKRIISSFLDKHPESVCITMGDKDSADNLEFDHPRVIKRSNIYPMRQSLLMTEYADMVISAESGLPVMSTLSGTATVQIMTAASIKNHGGDFPNDFSIQSTIACSPCHKGPYDYIGCPMFDHLGIKYPKCIKINAELLLNRMEEAYDYARCKKANAKMSVV